MTPEYFAQLRDLVPVAGRGWHESFIDRVCYDLPSRPDWLEPVLFVDLDESGLGWVADDNGHTLDCDDVPLVWSGDLATDAQTVRAIVAGILRRYGVGLVDPVPEPSEDAPDGCSMCDDCGEYVHVDDSCGRDFEYLCGDCYADRVRGEQ